MKRAILTTAALAAVILLASAASAADTDWQPVQDGPDLIWTGDWNDTAHWTNGVPDSSKTAAFPDGGGLYTVTMDVSGACKTLAMHSTAILEVPTSTTLAIGNADTQSSSIDGTIQLLDDNSALQFGYDHTISGSGSITGQDDDATLTVASTKTLTNQTNIKGSMQIRASDATFTNDSGGIVEANRSTAGDSMLQCYSGTFNGSGQFKVTAPGATLQFRVETTSLTSTFTVSNGTLDIDANVSTSGDLDLSNTGKITIANGASFKVNQ